MHRETHHLCVYHLCVWTHSWEQSCDLELLVKLIFSEADHTRVEWLPLELIPWGAKGKKGKGHS